MKHKQHMIRTNNLLTRIIALVLALIIGILSVPRAVHAMEINEDFSWRDNFENYLEYLKEASLDDSSAVKAGNWGLAHYHDRLPWNYFHNKVQNDIIVKYKKISSKTIRIEKLLKLRYTEGVHKGELTGKTGRADIYLEADDYNYIWEVKPYSYSIEPNRSLGITQLETYRLSDPDNIRIGGNQISGGTICLEEFDVVHPSYTETVKYTIEYTVESDGLILYSFYRELLDRRTNEETEIVKETGAEYSKAESYQDAIGNILVPKGIPGLVSDKEIAGENRENQDLDWEWLTQLVVIANTISVSSRALSTNSVNEALAASSARFLYNIGMKFGKTCVAAGGVSAGLFVNANNVIASESDLSSEELADIQEAISEYENALEVLLDVDSLEKLINYIDMGDSDKDIEEAIKNIQNEKDEYEIAGIVQMPKDPLIIDLGMNGVDLVSITKGVYFDLDNNGYAERTAWIGTEDAFLAMDRNNNGIIDNGGELFGNQVEIGEGKISVSGFEALSVLDGNNDKLIDKKDDCYDKLLLWVDYNHNGYSEKSELKNLNDYGIETIQLNLLSVDTVDTSTGTMISETAKVFYMDNTETTISEFWFPINSANTVSGNKITAGNVPSIEQAIKDDNTGVLNSLLCEFYKTGNIPLKRYLLRKIIYFITGAEECEINSRGTNIDARELHVIEKFMGSKFSGAGGTNPNQTAVEILKQIYCNIEDYYYNILNFDSSLGAYKSLIFEYEDEDGNKKLDVVCFVYIINSLIEQGKDVSSIIYDVGIYLKTYDKTHGTNYLGDFSSYYRDMSDTLSKCVDFVTGINMYVGTKNPDNYIGTVQRDILYGESGNDTIMAEGGNDILNGGSGNDILNGGYGNDTYVFNIGDGIDIISDCETKANTDTISFGEGITPEDVRLERVGNNLVISYGETDRITVEWAYLYTDGRHMVEEVRFSDGTVWNKADIYARVK